MSKWLNDRSVTTEGKGENFGQLLNFRPSGPSSWHNSHETAPDQYYRRRCDSINNSMSCIIAHTFAHANGIHLTFAGG